MPRDPHSLMNLTGLVQYGPNLFSPSCARLGIAPVRQARLLVGRDPRTWSALLPALEVESDACTKKMKTPQWSLPGFRPKASVVQPKTEEVEKDESAKILKKLEEEEVRARLMS